MLHLPMQLVMTLAMTCVVIYIYTVIAFNFFHKFYIHQNGDWAQDQCQSMWRVGSTCTSICVLSRDI